MENEYSHIDTEDLELILWHYSELAKLFGEPVVDDEVMYAIHMELKQREDEDEDN